jgi:hypothetical protein
MKSINIYLVSFTPFPVSPRGEMIIASSPVREGWEEGLIYIQF